MQTYYNRATNVFVEALVLYSQYFWGVFELRESTIDEIKNKNKPTLYLRWHLQSYYEWNQLEIGVNHSIHGHLVLFPFPQMEILSKGLYRHLGRSLIPMPRHLRASNFDTIPESRSSLWLDQPSPLMLALSSVIGPYQKSVNLIFRVVVKKRLLTV